MKIAITGSTGLIGTSLVSWFAKQGHQLTRLVRPSSFHDQRFPVIVWDPARKTLDASALEHHDVVIHLAGDTVAGGRWTETKKKEILDSRVQGTTFLSETLARLQHPPKVFLSASACGYYGSRDLQGARSQKEAVRKSMESSPAGSGFLAEVARAWEKATEPAVSRGIRTIHLRTGMVLSTRGGALSKMLPLFKLGLGGKVGSGHQIISWISIEEFPRIVYHLITHESLSGPVNVTTPNPVSNKKFTAILGKILRRPTIIPLPAFVAKLVMGEMAEELLLSGACVIPHKLLDSGYTFLYPDLELALRKLLSQPI